MPLTFSSYRNDRASRKDDRFILLMGFSGAGKSAFISQCGDLDTQHTPPIVIGHGLESCTLQVQVYPFFRHKNRQAIYLIDTPGFDNTSLSDAQVLTLITTWLAGAYDLGSIPLFGVIYFHSLADRRVRGSAGRNCDMLRDLCGPDARSRTHLVTTMWDEVPMDDALERERAFVETPGLWSQVGGPVHRHFNTLKSARDIVRLVVDKHRESITLAIQREMVTQKLELRHTAAGRALGIDLMLASSDKDKLLSDVAAREAQLRASYEEHIGALEHVVARQKETLEPEPPQSDIIEKDGTIYAEWYKGLPANMTSLSGRDYWIDGKYYIFRHAHPDDPSPRSDISRGLKHCGNGHRYQRQRVYGIGLCFVDLCRDAAEELYIEHSDNLADHYALLADCLRDNADVILNLAEWQAWLSLSPAGTFWLRIGDQRWFNLPLNLTEKLRKDNIAPKHLDVVALGSKGSWLITITGTPTIFTHLGNSYPALAEYLRRSSSVTGAEGLPSRIDHVALDLQSNTHFAVSFEDCSLFKVTGWDKNTQACFDRFVGLEGGQVSSETPSATEARDAKRARFSGRGRSRSASVDPLQSWLENIPDRTKLQASPADAAAGASTDQIRPVLFGQDEAWPPFAPWGTPSGSK